MTAPEPISGMSAVKLALLAQRLRGEKDQVALLNAEPLAIVGIGCRFPGGVDSPAVYWQLLRDSVDAVGEVPADRWDVDAYYDPDPEAAGKMTTRYGAFLQQVDQFDPEFFGIAPREARRMDPQQRLLLEVAWEALEHAALPPDRLAGSATGVFMGACAQDFGLVQYQDPLQLDAYTSLGASHSIIANRLSYWLNVHGPSITIDTACSSSLVAVHLACQSLRARECDLALAGGVNLILLPDGMIALSRARMLAPDGRCKTFDARADGYVRGEGCGVIVLKRLADALRAGDVIQAVIRGSAVNQDGKSNGLTAPNLLAQQAVLRAALAQAQVPPETVGYLEAHGTGTALGDPIEVEALAAVYGQPRADGAPAWLGSVKTNLGHLEAAAGIAGLLKAVLALQQGAVPPHLHFQSLNPSIRLSGTPLTIPTALTPWPADGQPRRAGVSAFGFGGTNAHLILEEAPTLPMPDRAEVAGSQLLTLSAHHPAALQALAERYEDYLGAPAAASWPEVAATSHQGRSHLGERLAVAAADKAEAIERLTQWRTTGSARGVQAGRTSAAPKVAFLFPGQGVSLAGVGLGWYAHAPVFRAALDQCAELLAGELKTDLKTGLWAAPETELAALREQTAFIQPALVALGWALAEQFKAWGVIPAAVLGHSIGEYGAAVVAGRLSLAEGLRLAAARGRGMQALPAGGAMLSVEADEQWVADLLRQVNSQAVIAAVNAPRRVVVAGTAEQVAAAEAACAAAGVSVRRLSVGHAFHSPLMAPMLPGFGAALPSAAAQPTDSGITFVSGQWGRVAAQRDQLGPAYWRDQILAPVRYAAGVAALAALGCDVLIELGPGGQLSGLGQLSWEATGQPEPMWVRPLRGQGDEWTGVLESVGRLYTTGLALDWAALDGPTPHRSSLPTYPFQRQRFAIERVTPARPANAQPADLPLLGRRLPTALPAKLFEGEFSDAVPLLREHRLYDTIVVPGAAFLALTLMAAESTQGRAAGPLENVTFREPLLIAAGTAYTVQTIVQREPDGVVQVETFSRRQPDDEWRLHSTGHFRPSSAAVAGIAAPFEPASILSRCPEALSGDQFYQFMAARDTALGPSFCFVQQLRRGDGEALARLRPPSSVESAAGYRLHPGLIDACFQVFGATWPQAERDRAVYVPVSLERLHCRESAASAVWCHARLRPGHVGGLFVGDVTLYDEVGRALVEVVGLNVMAAPRASLLRPRAANFADWLYDVRWRPHALPDRTDLTLDSSGWLILADTTGLGAALQQVLSAHGAACRLVRREQLDAANPEALAALCADAAQTATTYRAVVCLWALDDSSEAAGAVSTATSEAVLQLVQGLAKQVWRVVPRLWLVTRCAQAVAPDDEAVLPEQALLWGLGRTVAHELPDLWGGLIDLARSGAAADAALLARLMAAGDEDQLAVRAGQCYAARLEPAALTRGDAISLDPDGAYLITGGLGAVGLALARWLVDNGARRLVLVGRHAVPNAATAEIEQSGATVTVLPCDVTQAAELAHLLSRPELSGLRGVIHAAGVLDDGALVQLTPERLRAVMAPKVAGAWQLHRQTLALPLDFFVLCSSAAAVFGSAGQANYAAANAYLDALAHHRRASGLSALSVNWGPFAQSGMAARTLSAQPQRAALRRLDALHLAQAGPMLAQLLRQTAPQAAVLPVQARDLAQLASSRSSLVAAVARQPELVEPSVAPLAARVAAAHPSRRAEVVLASVLDQAAAALALSARQTLDPRRPLREYGLDSLMALDLSTALGRLLGRQLPATLVYEHPTAEALTTYLARELGLDLPKPAELADSQRRAAVAEVQNLSEQELNAIVSATLESL